MRPETIDKLKPYLFWFAAAFLIRLAYLFEQGAEGVMFFQPILDNEESINAARALLNGEGFGAEPFFKAPLHTVWIALHIGIFGEGFFYSLRFAQHVLGALLAPIVFSAARLLVSPGRGRVVASHVAALLITIHAPLVRLENRLVLDFLVFFFQSAMIWALIMAVSSFGKQKLYWFIGAGVLAGLAWLTRPTLIVALPFIVIWILGAGILIKKHRKSRLIYAGVFVVPFLLAVLIFGVRNKTTGGEMLFLPWQGGYALYHANNETANGKYYVQEGFKKSSVSKNPTRQFMINGYLEVNNLNEIDSFGDMDSWWKDQTKEMILDDLGRWLGLMVRKTLFLTSDREVFNFEFYDLHREYSNILSLLPGRFGIIWPFALAAFAFVPFVNFRRRRLVLLLIIYGITIGGGIILYYASGRMRMPIVFPAILLAAFSIGQITDILKSSKTKIPLYIAPVLFIAGIGMSWHNVDGVRTETFADVEYIYWSHGAWRDGLPELALEFADKAAEYRPDYPTIPQLRAQALYSLQRYEEAEAAMIESLKRIPENPSDMYNLSLVQYEHLDKVNEALVNIQKLKDLKTDNPRVDWLLARILFTMGNIEEAESILEIYPEESLSPQAPMELLLAHFLQGCVNQDNQKFQKMIAMITQGYGEFGQDSIAAEIELSGCAQVVTQPPVVN